MKTKDVLREEIWHLLKERKASRFPGTHGRIPNFVGAERCVSHLTVSSWWQHATTVKINPDLPQRPIRQKALEEGKLVIMPAPRLRAAQPFLRLDPARLTVSPRAASSIKGAAQYGSPIGLDDIDAIDLIVCGSVAVNRFGARVGKGGGYSDLEFGLLIEAMKIKPNVPIVTSVHSLQLVEQEIDMLPHDIPVDAIVTPERLLNLSPAFPRPAGIYWEILPEEKLASIPVLAARRTAGVGALGLGPRVSN